MLYPAEETHPPFLNLREAISLFAGQRSNVVLQQRPWRMKIIGIRAYSYLCPQAFANPIAPRPSLLPTERYRWHCECSWLVLSQPCHSVECVVYSRCCCG